MSMRRTSDLPDLDHNSNLLSNDTLIEVFDKRHFPGEDKDGYRIPSSDYYDSYKYKVTGLSNDIKTYDNQSNYLPPVIANAKAVHDYVENITTSIGSITVSNLCSDVECRHIANINNKPLSAPIAQVVDNFQGNSLCTVAIGSIDGKALHVPTFKIYRNSNNTFVGNNSSLTPDNLIGVISSDNNGHELSLYTLRAIDHVSSTYNDEDGIKIATIFDRISGSWADSTLKLSTKNIYIPKKLSTDLSMLSTNFGTLSTKVDTLSTNLSTLSSDVYGTGGRPSQLSDIEPGILPRLSTLELMGGGIIPAYIADVGYNDSLYEWQTISNKDLLTDAICSCNTTTTGAGWYRFTTLNGNNEYSIDSQGNFNLGVFTLSDFRMQSAIYLYRESIQPSFDPSDNILNNRNKVLASSGGNMWIYTTFLPIGLNVKLVAIRTANGNHDGYRRIDKLVKKS